MLIAHQLRRRSVQAARMRGMRVPTRWTGLSFSHARAEGSWHVDCIASFVVNEDCGPPDCRAIAGSTFKDRLTPPSKGT